VAWIRLSEQHPREQGLKLMGIGSTLPPKPLSEQHPREQGLKHGVPGLVISWMQPFRATSKRTRIETPCARLTGLSIKSFQSNIQENKD